MIGRISEMKEEHMPDRKIDLVPLESEQSSNKENLDFEIIPFTETTISNISNNSDLLVQSNTDYINQNSYIFFVKTKILD